jgi:hypothetical protein
MPAWQRNLFSFLVRNVGFLVNFMGIPSGQLIVYLAYIDIDHPDTPDSVQAV